jgi:hypothetical protein
VPIRLKAVKISFGRYVVYACPEGPSLDPIEHTDLPDLLVHHRKALEVAL